jgi:hypothetical protein
LGGRTSARASGIVDHGDPAGGGGLLDAADWASSTLGLAGTAGSGIEAGGCGARDVLAGGVASGKARSSIGAALRLVNPNSWDKALIPARQSSVADGVRARRAGAGDFGVAAGDGSGADDGCVAWLTAGLGAGIVSAGCGAAGCAGSARAASPCCGTSCAAITGAGIGVAANGVSMRGATPGDAADPVLGFEPVAVGGARRASVAGGPVGDFGDAADGAERAKDAGGDLAGERLLAFRSTSLGGEAALEFAFEFGTRIGVAAGVALADGGCGSSAASAFATGCAADAWAVAVFAAADPSRAGSEAVGSSRAVPGAAVASPAGAAASVAGADSSGGTVPANHDCALAIRPRVPTGKI